jgi:hypothetical protein
MGDVFVLICFIFILYVDVVVAAISLLLMLLFCCTSRLQLYESLSRSRTISRTSGG